MVGTNVSRLPGRPSVRPALRTQGEKDLCTGARRVPHAELHEMNKAPHPITGPPSSPHPTPSPGLSQPSFPPGQPPSVVFATPQPPQMNPTQQPRQPYYNRASLPSSSGPRGVSSSSAPRPVAPTHVYQMIPQQQLSFPSSPQGTAYFIGQYRSPTYVATPQQYPVPAGTPGFYPGTSPAEYGTYAGAYYPAQAQFTPPVQAAPVIMNPAPQQQQPLPQQPQHIPPTKRERKQIIIRDPNQGGRDITEEIMSGGRSGSTPTPPQTAVSGSESSAANGESITAAATPALVPPDDSEKASPLLSKSPDLTKEDSILTVTFSSDASTKTPTPPSLLEGTTPTLSTTPNLAHSAPLADVMDAPPSPRKATSPPQLAPEIPAYPAPLPDPISTKKKGLDTKERGIVAEEAAATLETPLSPSFTTTNGVAQVEKLTVSLPAHQLEPPPLESPIAQPEELRLPNGLPLPAPQDPEAPAVSTAERDDSPIAEPEVDQESVLHPTPHSVTTEELPSVAPAVPKPSDQQMSITPAGQEVPAQAAVEVPLTKTQVEVPPTKPQVEVTPTKPQVEVTPTRPQVEVPPTKPQVDVPPTKPLVEVTPTKQQVEVTPTKQQVEVTPSKRKVEVTPTKQQVEVTPSKPQVEVTPTKQQVEVTPSKPQVEVTPTKPQVEVTSTKPQVEVTPTNPQVEVTPTKPQVEVTPTKPQVEVTPTKPQVEVTPTKPQVEVTPTRPQVEVTSTKPQVEVTSTKPQVEVTPTRPQVEVTSTRPQVEVTSTKPQVEVTLPEVASNVSEEVSEKCEAKEATPSPVEVVPVADSTPEQVPTPPPAAVPEEKEEPPAQPAPPAFIETTTQAAVSVPKKKRKMKDLNKKEAVGDLLDAFKEEQVVVQPEPEPTPAPEPQPPADSPPAQEEADLTWEDKEDKLDAENIQPTTPDKEYQYKGDQWKPINKEEKKQYDRDFLLGFQFISASMNKPQGLPAISDVVLDKANKTPLRTLDPSRIPGMNSGPDFTPSFANLGRPGMGGGSRGPPPGMGMGAAGPRRSQQMQRKEPRKIITSMSLNDDVKLNKAEKAWKSSAKKSARSSQPEELEESESEQAKTLELFKQVRSILNKLTPQKFQKLMKQVTELTIDTEERLKGVIDITFEKAISEPDFSVAYANMCRGLIGLKVQTKDKPGSEADFRKLLLNRCQKEFEKDKDDDEIFEKKQKELDAASGEEEKQRLREELEEAKDKARRRSLGNIKFIGELFKLKMLTEVIMHDCIVKLLKNHDKESLECLCRLLSTIGKDLDFEKAKPRMDQYFHQMGKIVKEKKTSSRIRFMLQDVLDLRGNNWVPRRGDQGPKTIDQIHKEAEMEEHREQMKVQQAIISNKNTGGGPGGRMGGGGRSGRGAPPQDEGWNTVPISKNRPIDTSRLSKITKNPVPDFNNQLLAPGGKGMWGSWGKGSSGGSSAKANDPGPDSGSRPATSTLNRFSALQQHSRPSADTDRRVPQRNSSSRERSDRFDRSERGNERFDRSERGSERFDRRDSRDRNQLQVTKRSFSREKEERVQDREQRGPSDVVRRVSSTTEDKEKGETAAMPPLPQPTTKSALTEEQVEQKATAIIEEYLHIKDLKEAVQCVKDLASTQLLFVFVRNGLESTLDRSPMHREHMGLLFHQLIKTGSLPAQQYYKGLQEILEVAEDMAIDIPHMWLYLAELITPMLHEGGVPMGELFSVISKHLVPLSRVGVLLVHILTLLCKEMSHKKAGTMWREAGLQWKDFLPEDVDVNKFVTEKNVEFTLGDESESEKNKEQLSSAELSKHLDKLLKENADNQRISDWVEANLDEQQTSSNTFVRVLMTSICQSTISHENTCKVIEDQLKHRTKLLQKFLKDEQLELQGVYALQALMVELEQPANMLQKFFNLLYDEDVIKDETFLKWANSKDATEQQGKGVALKSVTNFIKWLEDEAESDNS
ncbi:eukaryotic translation initiation factor 4 gamma 1 isoform X3 [Gouania willdenowi]|uniref:Eukaryotic translation initiation factor 4 gamma 1-like n=1 Tax=Gouania willdenowi TaxID=441366 RepID=A0A8C5N960_GOUWI|nr:eukaryotic translation initiation factor 4 gamma 1-like isoform X3 [Gouania willdenowi]